MEEALGDFQLIQALSQLDKQIWNGSYDLHLNEFRPINKKIVSKKELESNNMNRIELNRIKISLLEVHFVDSILLFLLALILLLSIKLEGQLNLRLHCRI